MRWGLTHAVAWLLVLVIAVSVDAAVRPVACCLLQTLKSEIGLATSGDILTLAQGTYPYASGTLYALSVAKSLTIVGDPGGTTISLSGMPDNYLLAPAAGFQIDVSNIVFRDANATFYSVANSVLNVDSCTFTNCFGEMVLNGRGNFSNTVFSNNLIVQRSMFYMNAPGTSSLTVTGCTFKQTQFKITLFTSLGNIMVTNCRFDGTSAVGTVLQGNALFRMSNPSNLTVEDTTFSNSYLPNGVVYNGLLASLTRCTVYNLTGQLMFNALDAVALITDTTMNVARPITPCPLLYNFGTMLITGGTYSNMTSPTDKFISVASAATAIVIRNTRLLNNDLTMIVSNKNVTLINVYAKDNKGNLNGFAFNNLGGTFTFVDCWFENITSPTVMFSSPPPLTLTAINTTFVSSTVLNILYSYGPLSVANCTFTGNKGDNHILVGTVVSVTGTRFVNNLFNIMSISGGVGSSLFIGGSNFTANRHTNPVHTFVTTSGIPVSVSNTIFVDNYLGKTMFDLAATVNPAQMLSVVGCRFINNFAVVHMILANHNISIAGSTFVSNTANGAIIYGTNSFNLLTSIVDTTFTTNSGNIGMVYCNGGAPAAEGYMRNITITGDRSQNPIVSVMSTQNLYVYASTVLSTTAPSGPHVFSGGNVYVNGLRTDAVTLSTGASIVSASIKTVISNARFSKIKGRAVNSPLVTIGGSTFTNINVTQAGGTVGVVSTTTSALVENTTFTSCSIVGDGGAIAAAVLTVNNGTFIGCTAAIGGAVRASTSFVGSNLVFTNNYAGNQAGALYGTTVSITGYLRSTNNYAVNYGGCIVATDGVTISGSTSFGVQASVASGDSAGTTGGFLYLPSSSTAVVSISQISIINTRSITGGALSITPLGIALTNVVFSGATASATGGSMLVSSPGTALTVDYSFTNVTFNNCRAGSNQGGALTLLTDRGTTTLTSCTVTNNNAGGSAGGLSISANANALIRIVNTTIVGNTARTNGGGLYATGAGKLVVTSSTIRNNAANLGGGLYASVSFYVLNGTTAITCNVANMSGNAIYCTGAAATVGPLVQVASSNQTNSTTDVFCNSCTGQCYGCPRCGGACGQSGALLGCYPSDSGCTSCAAGFSGPTCGVVPSFCPGASTLVNKGYVVGGCNGTVGETCRYACLPGFGNTTSLEATCGLNGAWSNNPICLPCGGNCVNCSSPGVCTICKTGWTGLPACTTPITCSGFASSGNVTSACEGLTGMPYLSTCVQSCGTTPLINTTVTCVDANVWSPASVQLTCPPVVCAGITVVPSHATLGTCAGTQVVGATCALDCQDGYVGTLATNGMCTLTGAFVAAWMGQTITCNPASCATVTALPTHLAPGTCENGLLGTSCQLSCTPGYAATNITLGVCTPGVGPTATWVGQDLDCVASDCGTVTSTAYPPGGNAGNCSIGTIGATCFLGCESGYNVTSITRGTCTATDPPAWVGMSVQCTPATCAAAMAVPDGAIIGSCVGGGNLGDACYFDCSLGYETDAFTPGICTPTGPGAASWIGQNITCTQATCPDVTALPLNAAIGTCVASPQGNTCLLSCAPGFTISNQQQGTCVAAGAAAVWSGMDITCTPAMCPTATSLPANAAVGTCTGGVSLYEACLLSCQSGYVPSNVVPGLCSPVSVGVAAWSGQSILCTAGSCPALVVGVTFPNTVGDCLAGAVLGASCHMGCADGYSLGSSSPGICSACGVGCAEWIGAARACVAVSCAAPSLAGVMNAVTGSCGAAPQGATCMLGCTNGYVPSGVATSTCMACTGACAQWTPLTITCTAALCPAPTLPPHAAVGTCIDFAGQGTTCNLTCLDGYIPSGMTEGSCQPITGPNAVWTGQSITCTPALCAPLTGLISGRTAGSCTLQPVGAACTMGCMNGYIASGSVSGLCSPGLGGTAAWINAAIICTPASCAPVSPLSLPAHATPGSCNMTQILGSTCQLDCEYGYMNANNQTLVTGLCNATGPGAASWVGQDIICVPPGACTAVNDTVYGPHGTPGNCTSQPDGTICELGCVNGFVATSWTYGFCDLFTWVGMSITCTAATCAPASPPASGNIGTCGFGAQGANCSFACNDGYVPSGAVVGYCLADAGPTASWQNPALTCSPAFCVVVSGLSAGQLENTCTSRALGATCMLACANGYETYDLSSGTCTADIGPTASWQNQYVTCNPAYCDAVVPPLNALLGTCDEAPLGSTCNLTCSDGYAVALGSQHEGRCVAGAGPTAVWVNMVIICTPASCAALIPTTPHAVMGSCTMQPLGTTCSLSCAHGYVSSASVAVCVADTGPSAFWSNAAVNCTPAICAPVVSYPSQATPGSCTTMPLGCVCDLGCSSGYVPSAMMDGTCVATGPGTAAWQGQSITCTPAQCNALVPPSGVLVGSCGVANIGSSCQMTCMVGYSVSGLMGGTCLGSGIGATWQYPTITCSPVNCKAAKVPSHAVINTCQVKPVFTQCTLDCASGYQASVIGNGLCEPTVGPNAQWVNTTITCIAVGTVCFTYAESLPPHANVGTCLTSQVGATCALGCDAGYVPTAPSGKCLLDQGSLFPAWKNLSISCSPASCVTPTTIPPHSVARNCTTALLGSTCALGCANGYVPNNTRSGICVPDMGPTAVWSGQNIDCLPAMCAAASAEIPTNGVVGSCQVTVLGGVCALACRAGTISSGAGTLTCVPGVGPVAVWSVTAALTCTALDCAPLQSVPAHATVGTCTSGPLDAMCEIDCEDGYALSESTQGTCTATTATTVSWQGASGVCTAVDCDALSAAPDNAGLGTCGRSAALGESCDLVCASGFTASGSTPGVCSPGSGPVSTWQGQSITCTANAAFTGTTGAVVAAPNGNDGALIGGIVGGLLALILCCLLFVVLLRRKRDPYQKPRKRNLSSVFTPGAKRDSGAIFTDSQTVVFDSNATHLLDLDSTSVFATSVLSDPNPVFASRNGAPGGEYAFTGNTSGMSTAGNRTSRMEVNIHVEDGAPVRLWEDFRVIRELGVGTVGPAMLVQEKSTYTDMVYKVYSKVTSPEQFAAFQKQAAAAMGLHNQFVTASFGVLKHDEQVGLLVEYMAGGALSDPTLALKPTKKLAHLIDGCKGLAYIHTRNLAHGNVKPANILIDAHGVTKLADFSMGTGESDSDAYAAPEVIRGAAPSPPSDIFSFGLSIGELFLGRAPFSHMVGMRRVMVNAQPWENMEAMPAALRALVDQCLDQDASRRPTATALIEALSQVKL